MFSSQDEIPASQNEERQPLLDDDDNNDEIIRVAPQAQNPPASFAKELKGSKYSVASIASGTLVLGIAAVTAIPSAVNALCNPAGISPSKLGLDWWNGMPTLTRAKSIINCASSFSINTIMNNHFLPTAVEKLKKNLSIIRTGRVAEVAENCTAIVIALGGAVAAGAIAYDAFLWLPYGAVTAFAPAAISFTVTAASRYISVNSMFKQLHNLFEKDPKAQAEFAYMIDHIDEKHLIEVQAKFKDIMTELLDRLFAEYDLYIMPNLPPVNDALRKTSIITPEGLYQLNEENEYELILDAEILKEIKFDSYLDRAKKGESASIKNELNPAQLKKLDQEVIAKNGYAHGHRDENTPLSPMEFSHIELRLAEELTILAKSIPDLVKRARFEYLIRNIGPIVQVCIAAFLIGYAYFLTFMQKGWDGVFTLAKFAGPDLSGMNIWFKRLIGAVPGIASALLAFDKANTIAGTMMALVKHLYENPKHIPFASLVLGANYFAASGPQNIAETIAKKSDNIIDIQAGTTPGTAYVDLNAAAGGIINTNVSVNKAFLSETPTPRQVELKHVKKHVSDVNNNLVTSPIAHQFRLFANTVNHHLTAADEEKRADFLRTDSAGLIA